MDATLRMARHLGSSTAVAAQQQRIALERPAVPGRGAAGAEADGAASLASSDEEGDVDEAVAAAEEVSAALQQAAQLRRLFEAPDLEFGCFAAVHGPASGAHGGRSLLRIDPGECQGWRGAARARVCVFVCVCVEQQGRKLQQLRAACCASAWVNDQRGREWPEWLAGG